MKKLFIATTIALMGCSGPQLRTAPADTGYTARTQAARQVETSQNQGPNFWDKYVAVRSRGVSGLSAVLAASAGTGAGWAPGMVPPQAQPTLHCVTTDGITNCW